MNEIVADIVEIIKGAPNEIEAEHKVPDFATQKQRGALCIKAPRLFFQK